MAVSSKIVPVFPNGLDGLIKTVLVGVQVVPIAGGHAPPVPRFNLVIVNVTPGSDANVRKFAKATVSPGGVSVLLMCRMWPNEAVVGVDRPANVPVLIGLMMKLPSAELQVGPPGELHRKLSEVSVAVTLPLKSSSPVTVSANTDNGTRVSTATVIKTNRLLIRVSPPSKASTLLNEFMKCKLLALTFKLHKDRSAFTGGLKSGVCRREGR